MTKKQKVKIKPFKWEGNHPVFETIAEEIAEQVCFQINQRTTFGKIDRNLRKKVGYPAQLVLELVVKKLTDAI